MSLLVVLSSRSIGCWEVQEFLVITKRYVVSLGLMVVFEMLEVRLQIYFFSIFQILGSLKVIPYEG